MKEALAQAHTVRREGPAGKGSPTFTEPWPGVGTDRIPLSLGAAANYSRAKSVASNNTLSL